MLIRITRLVALTALLSSCAVLYPGASIEADWQARRARWVEQNQQRITPEVADAVRRGEIIMGMTVEEAHAAWAGWIPGRVNRTVTASGTTEQYTFHRGSGAGIEFRFFYVQNGRVTEVQDSPGR